MSKYERAQYNNLLKALKDKLNNLGYDMIKTLLDEYIVYKSKSEQYDLLVENSTAWYIIAMKQANEDFKILADGVKSIIYSCNKIFDDSNEGIYSFHGIINDKKEYDHIKKMIDFLKELENKYDGVKNE